MAMCYCVLMAALLERIDQFNPEQEEWPQYVEWLKQFFKANDITGEGEVACYLHTWTLL